MNFLSLVLRLEYKQKRALTFVAGFCHDFSRTYNHISDSQSGRGIIAPSLFFGGGGDFMTNNIISININKNSYRNFLNNLFRIVAK